MAKTEAKFRVLIAAGGSGGHIFPALQVARAIGQIENLAVSGTQIEFIGTGRAIEKSIYKKSGYIHHQIEASGVKGRGLKGIISFLCSLPATISAANRIISEFKPDIMLGFGGYPSVVPLLVAACRRIPTWIHESDQLAGLANKFLSLFAGKVSSSFQDVSFPFGRQAIYSGHPIRAELQPAALPAENYMPAKILVLGGSQAASSLDSAVPQSLASLCQSGKSLEVVHQARAENTEQVERFYSETGVKFKVLPFIEDIPEAYASADIIISRSGSGSVAEIAMINKPVIFVPLPHVSGHQLQNARWLEQAGKAFIVEEGDDFEVRLQEALRVLLDPAAYSQMIRRPLPDRKTDAAKFLAAEMFSYAGLSRKYLKRGSRTS